MTAKRLAAMAAIFALLTGCQPPPNASTLPGGTSVTVPARGRSVSLGAPDGGSIRLNVVTPGGLRTQDLPKTLRNVHHFTAELWKVAEGGNPAEQVPGASIRLEKDNNFAAEFVDVPSGTFEMRVKAMATDDETQNITKDTGNGPYAVSGNTATINNGVITYNDSRDTLWAVVPLLDGNLDNLVAGPIKLEGKNRATALATADKTGLALFNNGSLRSVPFPADVSNIFYLTDVQQGAHADAFGNSGGPTHEIWAYAVDSANNLATPAFPTPTVASDTGAIVGPITVSFAAPTLSTVDQFPGSPLGKLAFDDSGMVYWRDSTTIRKYDGAIANAVNSPGASTTSFAVAGDGTIYWANGTEIRRKLAAEASSSTGDVAIPGVPSASHLQVDEEGNLYWVVAGTNSIMRALASGAGWSTPEVVATEATPVTAMGVTAYGDIVYATDIYLKRLDLDLAGISYGAAVQVGSPGAITGLAVDRPGNIYYTFAGNHRIRMVPAGETGSYYNVAGTGTNTPADAVSGVPTTAGLSDPTMVTVSRSGKLAFVSKGTNGTDLFLRRIQ